MAGTYVLGETKVRPGAYFNIQKKGTGQQSGTVSGVTAVLFRSDFGPLNTAVELNPDDGFANTFGNGGTTDAIQEAINGGAQTIIACRVGNGGTSATATLNTAEGQAAVKITAAYPGKKAFTVTVREKLTDSTLKECIIYAGVTEFEKVEFTAGAGEAKALADAFAATCAPRSQTPASRLSGSRSPEYPSPKGGATHRFLSYPRQYHQAQRGPFRCCRSRLPQRDKADE